MVQLRTQDEPKNTSGQLGTPVIGNGSRMKTLKGNSNWFFILSLLSETKYVTQMRIWLVKSHQIYVKDFQLTLFFFGCPHPAFYLWIPTSSSVLARSFSFSYGQYYRYLKLNRHGWCRNPGGLRPVSPKALQVALSQRCYLSLDPTSPSAFQVQNLILPSTSRMGSSLSGGSRYPNSQSLNCQVRNVVY